MINILHIVIFSLLVNLSLIAQDAQFTASVNKNEIAVGERFQVTFQLNVSGSNFAPPSFDKFRVLSGPNQSSSMQWVNGQMSSSISFSYILAAVEEGEFNIGSASIKAGGKNYSSNPIKIKVVKGVAQQQQVQPNQQQQPQQHKQQPQQQQGSQNEISGNLFLKLYTDKTKVYQGEQIVVAYKIYTRLSIVDNNVSKLPAFNGFWSQDIELPQQAKVTNEVLNGLAYNVATLKQSVLFPQRSGILEVDPLEMDIVVRMQDVSRPRSIFDQFFGMYKDVKYVVPSNALKVEVLSLPATGKPESFSGAVGKYSFEATLDKDKVKTNDAINLKIAITGRGNIKLIEPLKVKFPPDFEVYDPKISDKITTTIAGVNGRREFEYLVIPRHSGIFQIDPIEFSYFDPVQKQYVRLSSGDFKIDVEKGSEPESTSYQPVMKEDVKFIGRDIRFIKSGNAELKEKGKFFFNTLPYYALILSPLLVLLFSLIARKKLMEYNSDLVKVKSRRATKLAIRRLSTAKRLLAANNNIKFYEEVFGALYGYLGDKLNIPVSALTKDKVAEILRSRNTTDEVVNELNSVLDRCEIARFAPVNDISQKQVYENAVRIISRVEEELRH